jgi:short-subunit dehydrogenase
MQTILITGASSGIGEALALAYAGPDTELGLLGRNPERLDNIAARCRKQGSKVRTAAIDVRARAELKAWIEAFDREHPVDLVFANAGVMAGTPPGGDLERADAAASLIETNVGGVLNTVQPLLPPMMARGRGQIAIVGSLAGFIPLPDAPSYSASKSAVLIYGLSLRALLAPRGIRVSVICPGYIETPMTAREFGPHPFKMSAGRAAGKIRRGLQRDRAVIAFPLLLALATRLNAVLPDRLRQRIVRRFRFTVADQT